MNIKNISALAFLFSLLLAGVNQAQVSQTRLEVRYTDFYPSGATDTTMTMASDVENKQFLHSPYKLSAATDQLPFTRIFLEKAIKNRIDVYSDSLFHGRWDGKDLKKEMYYLDLWLKNKKPQSAMRLPEYRASISAGEIWFWEDQKLKAWDRAYIRIDIDDESNDRILAQRFYMKPSSFETLLDAVRTETDLSGNRFNTLQDNWKRHDLHFYIESKPGTPLPSYWQSAWQQHLDQETSSRWKISPVFLVVPSGLNELSFKSGWSDSSQTRIALSKRMVRTLSPQIMRLVLLDKVKCFGLYTGPDREANERLKEKLKESSRDFPELTRRNIRSFDYSSHIYDLEIEGTWIQEGGFSRFEAQFVSLVWSDAEDDPQKESVVRIPISELKRRGVQFEGRPIDDALAEIQQAYYYIFGMNDVYIDKMEDAAIIDLCWRAGKMELIPVAVVRKGWTDVQRLGLMLRCLRP